MQKWVVDAGQKEPAGYTRGPRDFERLCETEDLDLVFNATPWEWHVPVCVAAMKNGKHAATEVPAAMTLDDCWQLVEPAEKYRKHCVMMENCNYDRPEMMVFNMVRQGLFGEVLHAEGGYLHDLREHQVLRTRARACGGARGRQKVNGNLYPTHGLGPVANCMDINRGDRFEYLVSMSGPSRGLQAWAKDHFPADAPQRQEKFVLGDVNVSPHQDGARPHDLRQPRHQPAAAVQPHPHGPGHARALSGLSRSRLHRGQAAPSTSGKTPTTYLARVRASAVGGADQATLRAPATAAWTTSRTTASSSACAKACRPT